MTWEFILQASIGTYHVSGTIDEDDRGTTALPAHHFQLNKQARAKHDQVSGAGEDKEQSRRARTWSSVQRASEGLP